MRLLLKRMKRWNSIRAAGFASLGPRLRPGNAHRQESKAVLQHLPAETKNPTFNSPVTQGKSLSSLQSELISSFNNN